MLKQYAKHVAGLNPRHRQVQNREERPTSAHNIQLHYCVHYVHSMEGLFKVSSSGLNEDEKFVLPPLPLDIHSVSVETMQQSLRIVMATKEHSLT